MNTAEERAAQDRLRAERQKDVDFDPRVSDAQRAFMLRTSGQDLVEEQQQFLGHHDAQRQFMQRRDQAAVAGRGEQLDAWLGMQVEERLRSQELESLPLKERHADKQVVHWKELQKQLRLEGWNEDHGKLWEQVLGESGAEFEQGSPPPWQQMSPMERYNEDLASGQRPDLAHALFMDRTGGGLEAIEHEAHADQRPVKDVLTERRDVGQELLEQKYRRDAIREEALPDVRYVLQSQGLTLEDVMQHSPRIVDDLLDHWIKLREQE